MPTVQFPVSGTQKLRIKSGRKPLRPRNISVDLDSVQNKAKPECTEMISLVADSNKENRPGYATPVKMECFDASLAEELSAVRKRRERLKLEGEQVERMLRERDLAMEMWMKEVKKRGEEQKKLEMEVDRLFRLKELRSAVRISPIRPLREREREKKNKETAPPPPASPFRRRSVLFLKASVDGSASPSPSQSPRLGSDRSKGTFPSPGPSWGLDQSDRSSKGRMVSSSPSQSLS